MLKPLKLSYILKIGEKMKKYFAIMAALALLAGCAPKPEMQNVSGQVTYLVRMALPPDANVIVRVEDVSRADALAEVLAQTEFSNEGRQVPIDFEIAYDPSKVDASHRYALTARIESADGQLMFINDTLTPVITLGSPVKDIQMTLALAQ